MNTEQKILKIISERGGRTSVLVIASNLKLGSGYTEYLCRQLLKRGLIKKIKKRNWYKITRKGQKEIGKRVELAPKIRKQRKKIKKIIKKKREKRPKKRRIKKRGEKKLKRQKIKKPKVKAKAKRKSKQKQSQTESLTPLTIESKEEEKQKTVPKEAEAKTTKTIEFFKKLFTKILGGGSK